MRRMSWLKIYYAFIVLERSIGRRKKMLKKYIKKKFPEYIDSVGRKINLIFDVYFTFNLTIILIINLQIINENYSYCLGWCSYFTPVYAVTLKLLRLFERKKMSSHRLSHFALLPEFTTTISFSKNVIQCCDTLSRVFHWVAICLGVINNDKGFINDGKMVSCESLPVHDIHISL